MELYPAVDIEGGRLARAPGPGQAAHPDAALRAFAAAGARWVHLVDLDRAYGRTDNHALVQRLLAGASVGTRVQVGGGLASELDIDRMFTWGAARVIIGAQGATDQGLVARLLARHGAAKLAVGIDVKDGRIAPRGTGGILSVTPAALATQVREQGIRTAIYNDVLRDGMLTGPNVAGARELGDLGLDVIVSGGIASLDDLRVAKRAGLAGAIVGRALHEGRFSFADALTCVA
ncbi:MAG: HisA/HisF-related TIM barrel protein [Gemmatimonadales bacterium]|nr:HisA/HisF-related TIM barrel protein [Gemmatimonadales bacterium]